MTSTDKDTDFADFATAAAPSAPSHAVSSVFTDATATASAKASSLFGQPAFSNVGKPYTAWYRVWERTSLEDFYQELALLPILAVVVLVHLWGVSANKSKAKQWAAAHRPLLESEFAKVGYEKNVADAPDAILREDGKNVYNTYATGRQNIAFLDVKLSLYKRFNPLSWFFEVFLSFFFDMVAAPIERAEATAYCFDGKEKLVLPQGQTVAAVKDSSIDGFVFAIVHKDKMKQLRNDRYDLSLTATKDHNKLPVWTTIMSESAEITDALLTPELIKAVEETGDDFEALIVSDQPIDAPKK